MSDNCRETLPDVQQWSRAPPNCPVVVGCLSRMSRSGREALPKSLRPSRMSKSGWVALPNVRDRSRGPPICPGVVGGPYRYSGVVRKPSRMSGSGQETSLVYREWSGDPPGLPGVVGKPFRMTGSS